MSNEDAENALKNKLLKILEDELLSLKIFGEKRREDEFPNDNLPEKRKNRITDKEEAFSASSNNSAETIIKSDKSEDEEHNVGALNHPCEKVGDVKQPASCQPQEIGRVLTDESYDPVSEQATVKYLQRTCSCRNDKICLDRVESFVPPSDNLAEKILRRVEFYFEDYNIFKNSFLLNHIRRNKKGFISLKLVASLRKVKTLIKDFQAVAYSLRKSKVLEFNSEGNKIRRIEPIPRIEDTKFGKTLMIFNLPQQNPTVDCLKELFSKFGTVVSVGVFGNNPEDCDAYHERCLHFHRRIASRVYGIVEFERYDQLVNALKDEEGHLPKENEMKAVPLMPQIYKKEKRHLKFVQQYNSYPIRRNRRFVHNDPKIPLLGASTKNSEVDPKLIEALECGRNYSSRKFPAKIEKEVESGRDIGIGRYSYNRGNYRRSYKARRNYAVPNTKNFWEGQVPNDYNRIRNDKLGKSQQLRVNNRYNIDHDGYLNVHPKKVTNGCIENGMLQQ